MHASISLEHFSASQNVSMGLPVLRCREECGLQKLLELPRLEVSFKFGFQMAFKIDNIVTILGKFVDLSQNFPRIPDSLFLKSSEKNERITRIIQTLK